MNVLTFADYIFDSICIMLFFFLCIKCYLFNNAYRLGEGGGEEQRNRCPPALPIAPTKSLCFGAGAADDSLGGTG